MGFFRHALRCQKTGACQILVPLRHSWNIQQNLIFHLKNPSHKNQILSVTWLSPGSYEVLVAVTGSTSRSFFTKIVLRRSYGRVSCDGVFVVLGVMKHTKACVNYTEVLANCFP